MLLEISIETTPTPHLQKKKTNSYFWDEKDLEVKFLPPSLLFCCCSVVSDSLRPHGLQHTLSITNSWSLLKLMSIESVLPSNHLHFCHPLLLLPSSFQASGSFPMSWLFTSGGQSIGASPSVLLTFRVDSVIYNAPKLKQQVTVQITGCYFSFVAM